MLHLQEVKAIGLFMPPAGFQYTKTKVVDDLNFIYWRSAPPSSCPSPIKGEGTNIAGQWINTGLGSGTFAVLYKLKGLPSTN